MHRVIRRAPLRFGLEASYPNPTSRRAWITYSCRYQSRIRLEIFDVQGRRVRTLVVGGSEAGPHRLEWNLNTDSGVRIGSGVYFMRLATPEGVFQRKLLVIR